VVPYGPEDHPEGAVELVETFGELELEYAALHKHCILMDQPNRALLQVSGTDRDSFLQSMLTQDLRDFPEQTVRRSFWLNNKGRIDADLRVIQLGARLMFDVDIHAAERTAATLSAYVIAEDLTIDSLQEQTHRLALHGPTSGALLGAVLHESVATLPEGGAAEVSFQGGDVLVFREDTAGVPGFEIAVPMLLVVDLYQRLVNTGRVTDEESGETSSGAARYRLRPAGWHAFNIARIENGWPLYNIDFGTESLPAETGVLEDRVSFRKGCYLGQEIVARMHSRGHPKQKLVAIKFESVRPEGETLPLLPVTGAILTSAPQGEAVGAVTSSTLSPMLGASPVAFAQVRWAHTTPGTVIYAPTGDARMPEIKGVVQPALAFVASHR
jgi:folate-binding protein YgfZ